MFVIEELNPWKAFPYCAMIMEKMPYLMDYGKVVIFSTTCQAYHDFDRWDFCSFSEQNCSDT